MLFKYGSGTGTNLSPLRSSNEQLGGRRHRQRPGVLHEGVRRLRRRHQERRHHASRRQDGHPQRRPPRRRGVHHLQGQRGAQGLGAHRGRLRLAPSPARRTRRSSSRTATTRCASPTSSCARSPTTATGTCARSPTATAWSRRCKARELMRLMAESAWQCGDPGIQYDTTINDWHTSANSGRINASNPCSEYMYLDDSACNLASLNLMKFLNDDGSFDVESYRHAVHMTITAQEILVGNAAYPTEKIGRNSEDFRPLGLGYANLGALLMARGVPYDSPPGRDLAACITAVMTGEAYAQSARMAREVGPFNGYAVNRQPMLRVIAKHREAAYNIPSDNVEADLVTAARHALGRGARARRQARLPQRAGDRARAHRHHRFHDGLRHHRRRAGHRARQVQEAGRRRHAQDRQPDRAAGTAAPRLRRHRGRRHRRPHRRQRHHRGCAVAARRGSRRLRLRVHPAERHAARSRGRATCG